MVLSQARFCASEIRTGVLCFIVRAEHVLLKYLRSTDICSEWLKMPHLASSTGIALKMAWVSQQHSDVIFSFWLQLFFLLLQFWNSYFPSDTFIGIEIPLFLSFSSLSLFLFPLPPGFYNNIVLQLQSQLQSSAFYMCDDIVGIRNRKDSTILLSRYI